jgi:hypothetical protein
LGRQRDHGEAVKLSQPPVDLQRLLGVEEVPARR